MTEQDLGGNETLPVAQEPRSGFSITGGKGFHMRFENGWTVSVQFGPYNYCSRRNTSFETLQTSKEKGEEWGSETAEIAAWPTKGEWSRKSSRSCRRSPPFHQTARLRDPA